MIRGWLGVALLAASWLFGLSYYHQAQPAAWVATVALGVVLLGGLVRWNVERWVHVAALALLILPIVWTPWPDRMAPVLIAAGLLLLGWRWPPRLVSWLGGGALAAGAVLQAQSQAIACYAALTARSHELPGPLASLLAGTAQWLGAEGTLRGNDLVLHSMRQVHPLGATWDLLVDPASCAFLAGGLALLAAGCGANLSVGRRWFAWLVRSLELLLVLLAWLPVRAALMIALYVHRELVSDPQQPLHVMNHFLAPAIYLLMLAGPALLAWRFVAWPSARGADENPSRAGEAPAAPAAGAWWKLPGAIGLAGLGAALWAAALYWEPIGNPKAGRVMVVERHTDSEPTTRPYDTASYGEAASYTYAAAFAYAGHYFQIQPPLVENDSLDDASLGQCDVLVIKLPQRRYSPEEIDAVVRFVDRGGGLFLIGDHTNLDHTGACLNDICRRFGFLYRYDLLFGTHRAHEDRYVPPPVAHPVVQNVPPMDFAVSCSIDPGTSYGRAGIQGTGLWSLGPEYHASNYYPQPYHQPEMRYGAFVQLWAAHYGSGRIVAFTDSTIFSNFCVFEPGKSEMLLSILDWLNRDTRVPDPGAGMWALGLGALIVAWLSARRKNGAWLLLLSAGLCGFVLAGQGVAAFSRWRMPPVQPVRPFTRVILDRTLSDVSLSTDGYVFPDGEGYALLEQWIPRLGFFPARARGAAALEGNALAVIDPTGKVSEEFRQRLVSYVERGGKLLVLDSAANHASTANDVLAPFAMRVDHEHPTHGTLSSQLAMPQVSVDETCEIQGGQPVARLADRRPVAAWKPVGKGAVLAVGFSTLFCDGNMGGTWIEDPDVATRRRYDVFYALFGTMIGGTFPPEPAPAAPAKPESLPRAPSRLHGERRAP